MNKTTKIILEIIFFLLLTLFFYRLFLLIDILSYFSYFRENSHKFFIYSFENVANSIKSVNLIKYLIGNIANFIINIFIPIFSIPEYYHIFSFNIPQNTIFFDNINDSIALKMDDLPDNNQDNVNSSQIEQPSSNDSDNEPKITKSNDNEPKITKSNDGDNESKINKSNKDNNEPEITKSNDGYNESKITKSSEEDNKITKLDKGKGVDRGISPEENPVDNLGSENERFTSYINNTDYEDLMLSQQRVEAYIREQLGQIEVIQRESTSVSVWQASDSGSQSELVSLPDTEYEKYETNTVNTDDDEDTKKEKLRLQELDKSLKQEKLDMEKKAIEDKNSWEQHLKEKAEKKAIENNDPWEESSKTGEKRALAYKNESENYPKRRK